MPTDEKTRLETLADDVMLASDQYRGFAQVWGGLDAGQRAAVRRLARRADRLIRDLCRSWDDYNLPDPDAA